MLKDYFEVPNKPAIKSGNVLSCDFTDHETFIPQPLDFTRNTLATYVDCNGIIKVSGVTDTNLSPPEDFANDFSSNPTSGTAVNNPDGTITFTNSSSSGANVELQNRNITTTKTYQIKFTISNYVQGTFRMSVGNQITPSLSANGTYVFYLTYTSGLNRNYFYTGNSTLTVSDISVKEVDLNTPRIDYLTEIGKAKELQKPSLLLEPQSTNLITYSENFSQWDSIGSTQTSTPNVNPIDSTAYKIESTVNTSSRIFISGIMTSTNTYSSSYLVKATSNSPQYLGFACISNTVPDVLYNFANDQFEDNTISGNAAKCESISMANNWKLLKVPVHSSVNNTRLNIYQGSKSGNQLVGTIGQSYFIKLAQLEELSYCTSYIPTSGSTVTRNVELCDNAGQRGVFNNEEGTIYVEFTELGFANPNQTSIVVSQENSSNNRVLLFRGGGSNWSIQIRAAGVNAVSHSIGLTTTETLNKFAKVAVRYKSGEITGFVNGSQSFTDSSTFTFNGNLFKFGFIPYDSAVNNNFYGRVKDVKVFRRTLTDSEMAELTNNIT